MKDSDERPMREEYDFSGGVRGKHARTMTEGSNLVIIDPDLTEIFPDSASVNEALRLLAKLAREQGDRKVG